MKTHVSLGMKYPFRIMFLVVLIVGKTEEKFDNRTVSFKHECNVIKTTVLPVRDGERDI